MQKLQQPTRFTPHPLCVMQELQPHTSWALQQPTNEKKSMQAAKHSLQQLWKRRHIGPKCRVSPTKPILTLTPLCVMQELQQPPRFTPHPLCVMQELQPRTSSWAMQQPTHFTAHPSVLLQELQPHTSSWAMQQPTHFTAHPSVRIAGAAASCSAQAGGRCCDSCRCCCSSQHSSPCTDEQQPDLVGPDQQHHLQAGR